MEEYSALQTVEHSSQGILGKSEFYMHNNGIQKVSTDGPPLQGSQGDIDIKDRLLDTVGEGEDQMG